MDCSTPGLPVPHHLPELAQVHGHCCLGISSSDALLSFCPLSFPASGTFPMSHLFASIDKNIGASASASVLPVNIQDWSLSRLAGLIFFLFKGLSHVFSGTTIQGHQFFDILPLLWFSCHKCMWPLGRPKPGPYRFCQQSNVSFSTHYLGLSLLSCQEATVFWFHGCSHHLQWFWSPRRGDLSPLPPFPLVFAILPECDDLNFFFNILS